MENENSFDKSLVNLVKLFLQTALTGAGMYPSMTHHPEKKVSVHLREIFAAFNITLKVEFVRLEEYE